MGDMNLTEILKGKAFDCLDAEQKAAYARIFERIQGKGLAEAMLIIADGARKLPKGREPSKDEQMMMMEAVLANAPEADRAKYQKLAAMMERL